MLELNNISNQTILISALDWGFGHTTRCVPIINRLLENKNKIIFAGNLNQNSFIKNEFSEVKIESLDGYNVQLSSKKSTYFQIIRQIFKIKSAIKKEKKWVKNYCSIHKIDLIISDNRYGFKHSKTPSIFISHQLNIEVPNFKKSANKLLAKHINQFNYCWIPDNEQNLSGTLSNPKHTNIPTLKIGLLSRFRPIALPIKYDYLFIVSGPTPENSIFLSEIESKVEKSNKQIAIVSTVESNIKLNNVVYNYTPTTQELNQLICESDTIISKSGYTTIMEMIALNKKAILIPTKGQFEQAYLAKNIKSHNLTFIESIKDLKI